MANDPCLVDTDSVVLTAVGSPSALEAVARVSPNRGNPLRVHDLASGLQGLDAHDEYVLDHDGVGVTSPQAFLVTPQGPVPTLGVRIQVADQFGAASRPYTIRLPGADGDPLKTASLVWPTPDDIAVNVQLAVADETNPRIDRIVATWSSLQELSFSVKTGAPTATADFTNLLGAAAVNENTEVRLADVLVDAGALTIASPTKVRDRRPLLRGAGVWSGSGPNLLTVLRPIGLDHVLSETGAATLSNHQSAAMVELECPVRANYLYWRYHQGTASQWITGTYRFAIYDVSRRLMVQTDVLNLVGDVSSAFVFQKARSAFTEPGRLLRPGYYFIFFGVGTFVSNGGSGAKIQFPGQNPGAIGVGGPLVPNVFWHRDTGSTNAPQTLDSTMTDAYADMTSTTAAVHTVPQIAIGEF